MLLGAHQFIEALVWLWLQGHVPREIGHAALWAYTFTPDAITVRLEEPGEPRVTRALRLLLDEINATPPSLPGDPRPIAYQLAAHS